MTSCPSRLILGQLITDDLKATRSQELEQHLNGCQACRLETESMRRNTDAYIAREAFHLEQLRDRIEKTPKGKAWRRGLVGVGITMAAAMIALVMFIRQGDQAQEPDVLYKGVMVFEVVAKRGDRQFRVEMGTRLLEGDAVRFVVFTSAGGYLYVFSLDAEGEVSPFYPDSDAIDDPLPMPLEAMGYHELPDSIVLDDAVGDEYFIVVFSETEFSRDEIEDQILSEIQQENLDRKIDIGPDFEVGVLRVEKTLRGIL